LQRICPEARLKKKPLKRSNYWKVFKNLPVYVRQEQAPDKNKRRSHKIVIIKTVI